MPQEIKHVTLDWLGDLRFAGGEPNGPKSFLDGDNASAPGPMLTLLLAAAGCTASDVVVVLRKKRVELTKLAVEVAGTRREAEPRRYVAIHLTYRMAGAGLDETKARHAIDLSIEKYCSVLHSLAGDIAVTYDLRLD
jgi:putative redox protein